ncbi:MAG: sulfite exporter TauE/SafE family protein [Bacteroidales bacterium]|jgi:uncharacterized membrane protein YfcA|nr:sulfite exporter TauE/SafE family protein [Bacteroidales bacterium]
MIIFELLSLTNHSNQIVMTTTVLLSLIVIGIITGVAAGMLGIGGAIIMVPALVFILGLSQHQAQGTSLAVMLPPIGIIAAYNYYRAGEVNLKFALILAGAFIIGSFFGSKFALNIPQHILKKIFAILLLLVSLKMLFSK